MDANSLVMTHKANQIVGEISHPVKLVSPLFAMLTNFRQDCHELIPRLSDRFRSIPRKPKSTNDIGILESAQVSLEERIQFDKVGIVYLRIDLPDERLLDPLSPQERILASHEVHIAFLQTGIEGVA